MTNPMGGLGYGRVQCQNSIEKKGDISLAVRQVIADERNQSDGVLGPRNQRFNLHNTSQSLVSNHQNLMGFAGKIDSQTKCHRKFNSKGRATDELMNCLMAPLSLSPVKTPTLSRPSLLVVRIL